MHLNHATDFDSTVKYPSNMVYVHKQPMARFRVRDSYENEVFRFSFNGKALVVH